MGTRVDAISGFVSRVYQQERSESLSTTTTTQRPTMEIVQLPTSICTLVESNVREVKIVDPKSPIRFSVYFMVIMDNPLFSRQTPRAVTEHPSALCEAITTGSVSTIEATSIGGTPIEYLFDYYNCSLYSPLTTQIGSRMLL